MFEARGEMPAGLGYRADTDHCGQVPVIVEGKTILRTPKQPWRPSIFMPRWASRITLEIEDVRVQRLQDISERDARAEGMLPAGANPAHYKPARDLFRRLWNDINEDRAPWSSNPWVWAISFRRVTP